MALGGVGVGMVAWRLASGIFLITRYSVTMSRIDRDMLNLLPHGVTSINYYLNLGGFT